MANTTSIEWTDATWNPVTGCTKISSGCDNCYAERDLTSAALNVSAQYFDANEPVVKEQLQKAGVRLARLLDSRGVLHHRRRVGHRDQVGWHHAPQQPPQAARLDQNDADGDRPQHDEVPDP